MVKRIGLEGTFFIGLCIATGGAAQVVQECSVVDGAGGRATGAGLTSLTAVAQPGAVSVSAGGVYTHYAGFLGCAILLPNLDTDADGLADELDPDNDNDGLTDLDETAGGQFNPTTPTDLNNPDSDDDGTADGDEAVAGTDPLDDTAYLHITDLSVSGPATVTWTARGGKTYRLWYEDDLVGGAGGLVTTITAIGGVAPWFETSATADDPAPGVAPHRAYIIEVLP